MKKKNFVRDHSLIAFYNKKWEILFQDRTSKHEKGWVRYGFFGGGVDKWETFLETCLRETKEELNLDLQEWDVREAVRFAKTVIWIGTSRNIIYVSPWIDSYEKYLQILEWDAGVWMALEQAKKEVFFNHDYMVFDLLEKYFEHEWIILW